MTKSFGFKRMFFCFVQMKLFESAKSSFISHSHPIQQNEFRLRSETGGGIGFPVHEIHRRNEKTRIASNNSPGPYEINDVNNPIEIPIIGPLLNVKKPVIVGDSIWLDPPTPLQWKAVEASVAAQHGGTIMNWKAGTASEIDEMIPEKINLATISTSPLVAILHSGGKDYATIAAIEGIVTRKEGNINTNDAESFHESLASVSSPYFSDSSKIRLMAIGRAKVSHFSTKFLTDGSTENYTYDENIYIERGSMENASSEPLLVARMELLFDSNEQGEIASSPVHALNRLSTFAQRVRFLQEDRQRIVKGLQAAQSRLEIAMDNWEDWDGIGSINNGDFELLTSPAQDTKVKFLDDDHQSDGVLNQFLEEYNTSSDESTPSIPSHSLPLSVGAARCIELDNYGLGTTSSAFVSLNSMTDVLVESLKNYFSPSRLQSEEFEYEVFSWCALQSLQAYLSSGEIHDALFKCTNTGTRLELIYQAMIKHKMDLNELAQAKSMELRNCGEECDLF